MGNFGRGIGKGSGGGSGGGQALAKERAKDSSESSDTQANLIAGQQPSQTPTGRFNKSKATDSARAGKHDFQASVAQLMETLQSLGCSQHVRGAVQTRTRQPDVVSRRAHKKCKVFSGHQHIVDVMNKRSNSTFGHWSKNERRQLSLPLEMNSVLCILRTTPRLQRLSTQVKKTSTWVESCFVFVVVVLKDGGVVV